MFLGQKYQSHEQTVPFEQTVPLRVNYKTLNDAALRGRPNDQFQMGLAYDQGNVPGVLQDHKAAWLWYIRAAEQGHAQAQNSLGGIYETKHKNKVVAHMWYNLAASNGSEQALTNRDRLSDYMTEIEIAKAQFVARICKSRSYKEC